MTKDEALDLALKALESERPYLGPMPSKTVKAITAIKQALAQPVQEPVAWAMYQRGRLQSFWLDKGDAYDFEFTSEHEWKPLYTTPPAQPAPVQEPVVMTFDEAYASLSWNEWRMRPIKELLAELHRLTTPPAAQRQWVGLTDEEIYDCDEANACRSALAYAIEAKLKEKNNG